MHSGLKQTGFPNIGKFIPRKIIPPVYFLASLVIMGLLAFFMPLSHQIYIPLRIFGGLMILAGLCLSASGAYIFKLSDTPVKPFEQPLELVTKNLYRFSRNPMYLGMMVMLFGAWLALGCLSPVLVIPVFFIIIQEGFIKYEEKLMEQTFGEEYLQYKSRVRRWL